MSEEKRIASVCDYDGLIAALRTRKAELGLSDSFLDELTGLQSGYTGKIFGPKQVKKLGPVSLGLLLQALGLKIVLLEDPETLAKHRERHEKRDERRVHLGNHAKPLSMKSLARMNKHTFRAAGKRGGLASLVTMAAEERTARAQRAARARWKGRRRRRG